MTGKHSVPELTEDAERPDTHGLYLYGIGQSRDSFEHLTVPETDISLTTLVVGELAAAVREVPLDEYSEETINARVQDYDWLINAAQEHQAVVAHVHQAMSILPAKFGTIYPSEQAVREALSETYEGVLRRLTSIDGCDEWAIHLFGDAEALREKALENDEDLHRLRDELENASPGRAYMLRQRVETRINDAAEEFEQRAVRNVFEAIRHLIRDFQSDPPNTELRTESGESEIARAAVLVQRGETDAFLHVVDSWPAAEWGVRIDVTGPWPPYSFTSIETDE